MKVSVAQHAIALALALLDVLVRGERIRILLPVPFWRAVIANTCGDALAALTPARWGGEPIRFLAFQRSGASAPAIVAAFATEVCVDAVLILLVVGLLATVYVDFGRAWLGRLIELATSRSTRVVTLAVVVALVLGAFAALRLRRHWPLALVHGVRDAWRLLTSQAPSTIARVVALTIVSMTARTAILPVLAAGVPGARPLSMMAGSFVLLFSQSVLPIPAGAGPVELGFAAWFAGTLTGGEVARLLLVWRFYTLVLGGAAGGVLMARFGLRLRTDALPQADGRAPDVAAM